MRAGWSVDDLEEPSELDFDVDPWEAALNAAKYEDDEDEDDE
jgi:hypothetical protein